MDKHDAIILGIRKIKTWYVDEKYLYSSFGIYTQGKEVKFGFKEEDVDLWSGELDFPPVNVGDKIYVSEKDIYITIADVIRTTYNEYIYKTTYVVEECKSETLEDDRFKAIEDWIAEEYPKVSKFDELKYFKPKESGQVTSAPIKMTFKDKWKEIKRILNKKYL